MELQQLKYFLVLAKIENVTKAAASLHIAQPALSQSIKRLELELDAPLFERKGRRLHLNDAGKFLAEKLDPLLQTLENLPAQVQEISGVMRKTIRVCSLSASSLATDIIIAYRELHPEVNFIAAQAFNNDEWDVCFTSVSAEDAEYPLSTAHAEAFGSSTAAFDEEIFLAVPKSKLEGDLPYRYLSSFADAPFITFTGAKPFKAICDRLCSIAGFTPHLAFQSDNPTAVRNLIAAGLGVAFWPSFSWGPLNSSQVELLHIAAPICCRRLLIRKSEALLPGSLQEDFFRFAVAYVEKISGAVL